jgi:transcription initiation factor TFIIIB Brf1 subunit/transcription initiation factor TFIIB
VDSGREARFSVVMGVLTREASSRQQLATMSLFCEHLGFQGKITAEIESWLASLERSLLTIGPDALSIAFSVDSLCFRDLQA